MRRNSGNGIRYPGHYRHDLLMWRMSQTGFTPKTIDRKSRTTGKTKVSEDTVMRAISGDCRTITKLWAIAEILNLNFSELFNFDLPDTEFDRAVLNGNSKVVRSSGSTSVGVRRPARNAAELIHEPENKSNSHQ